MNLIEDSTGTYGAEEESRWHFYLECPLNTEGRIALLQEIYFVEVINVNILNKKVMIAAQKFAIITQKFN